MFITPASLLVLALSTPTSGKLQQFCTWVDNQTLTISEQKYGESKREYLGYGSCEEGKPIIRFDHVQLLEALPCSSNCSDSRSQILIAFRGPYKTPVEIYQTEKMTALIDDFQNEFRIRKFTKACTLKETESILNPLSSAHGLEIPREGRFAASRGRRFHTGLDIPSVPGELVVAPAQGQIVLISKVKTQTAVFMKHQTIDGKTFFTSMAHLKDLNVQVGNCLEPGAPIGRTLTEDEFSMTKHKYIHVHLEVRKQLDDFGGASVQTRTRNGLKRVFFDPLGYLTGAKTLTSLR